MPFHVYIISNKPKGVLYIGVTRYLLKRIYEHKNKVSPGFSNKYNLIRLVYAEEYQTAYEAICREKQLKNWHRSWKIKLIESMNPEWNDLYDSLIWT